MKKFVAIGTGAILVGFFALSYGDSFKVVGPRAIGMGGAYVAVAEDALAQHWNPAGLAQQEWFDIQIPASGRLEFTGDVLKNANQLADLAAQYDAIQSAQGSASSEGLSLQETNAFLKGLKEIAELNKPGKGVLAEANAGGNFRFGRIALSVNNFTTVGGDPNVDLQNIQLGNGVAGAGTLELDFDPAGGAWDTSATGLSGEATLASIVADLLSNTGATAGGMSTTDIARGIINYAQSPAGGSISDAEINSIISEADQTNSELQALGILGSGSGNYQNNQSNLTFRGAAFTEVALGYGMPVPILPISGLYVGANLKAIRGDVGFFRQQILDEETSATEALSDFNRNAKDTWQPGVDAGALLDFGEFLPFIPFRPRVGLVGKNLNNPKFDTPQAQRDAGEGSEITLNPQVRAGAVIRPFNWWLVSADLDLTENKTFVPGFTSRNAGLGTEINIFNRSWLNIPLRAGLMKNIAEDSALTYTFGFGLNFLHFTLELGGAVSSETEDIRTGGDSTTVPANVTVAAQLAFNF